MRYQQKRKFKEILKVIAAILGTLIVTAIIVLAILGMYRDHPECLVIKCVKIL